FSLAETAADIQIAPPFVQKTRKGGYDGKGVQVIRQSDDMSSLWDVPSVIETLCPIEKEIAAIVAVDANGQQKLYPLVEMVFDEALNLVDVVQMPVQLSDEIIAEAERLALKVATAFGKEGLYAVEMFVTQSGEVWVNETACRVHNSGHLTIEACVCSQFEQMWRILAQQPLGETTALSSAAMLNLVGGKRQQGEARLSHLDDLLRQPRVYVHWYGKNEVRPGRKMGHVTLTAEQSTALPTMIQSIKPFLSVEAKS
ncbi:ATP-grasp domain-containing protein, partial [Suttonella ornithocola]